MCLEQKMKKIEKEIAKIKFSNQLEQTTFCFEISVESFKQIIIFECIL